MNNPSSDRTEPFGRFFLPGPTEVRPPVLAAQTRPVIGHRGPAIQELMARLQTGLRAVFGTERLVFISTSSASGLMEAAIRNGVRRRVLCLVNGAFSGRFSKIAAACGVEMDVLEVPWGAAHDPLRLAEALAEGRYDAVSVVHSETSTGVLNDLDAIADVVQDHEETLLLVDSVTGAGGVSVDADRRGLDFVLTGSQKALALPPGLSFGVASARMMARSESLAGKGYYFDLVEFAKQLEKLQTPTTPAISLMYALDEQLAYIAAEGLEARFTRHREMAQRCWTWVDEIRERHGLQLSVLAPAGYRSPTVTCVQLPSQLSGPPIVAAMAERGIVIGGGYGRLEETTIRIGHMGDHALSELETVLGELEEVLQAQ